MQCSNQQCSSNSNLQFKIIAHCQQHKLTVILLFLSSRIKCRNNNSIIKDTKDLTTKFLSTFIAQMTVLAHILDLTQQEWSTIMLQTILWASSSNKISLKRRA